MSSVTGTVVRFDSMCELPTMSSLVGTVVKRNSMFKLPKVTSSNVVRFLFVSDVMEFSTFRVSFCHQLQMHL